MKDALLLLSPFPIAIGLALMISSCERPHVQNADTGSVVKPPENSRIELVESRFVAQSRILVLRDKNTGRSYLAYGQSLVELKPKNEAETHP